MYWIINLVENGVSPKCLKQRSKRWRTCITWGEIESLCFSVSSSESLLMVLLTLVSDSTGHEFSKVDIAFRLQIDSYVGRSIQTSLGLQTIFTKISLIRRPMRTKNVTLQCILYDDGHQNSSLLTLCRRSYNVAQLIYVKCGCCYNIFRWGFTQML